MKKRFESIKEINSEATLLSNKEQFDVYSEIRMIGNLKYWACYNICISACELLKSTNDESALVILAKDLLEISAKSPITTSIMEIKSNFRIVNKQAEVFCCEVLHQLINHQNK